jgi:hypothetical protein
MRLRDWAGLIVIALTVALALYLSLAGFAPYTDTP